jgi:hypothetical protein
MAEPCLDCPSVVTLVGEGVSTGVAEHVRVRLEVEARAGGGTLDHPGEAGRRERRSPLADEDKRRSLALALEPAQGPELVAAQGVVLGVPFLTRRTCSTAALNSPKFQRRSQSSAARSIKGLHY